MRLTARVSIFTVCLLVASGFPALLHSALAQQPEKRIALVVGDGAYAKSPLATAANDAGLIAQTLQAAGFDVIGARDLDGDTLRKSFRDFVQKAQGAGPGTVAMVYLAGYGLQLAGENYFVPVDSAINRETDIPIEALRISDYVRQLASLPLKASIVVLDAARQQPFVEGQIASGLALVEADPHMLIAYNAAPGTVAPPEQGPYGAYAQSLAEMIRAGGLPLQDVFDRVRLRVNEATKGAQVPWDTHKLDAQFMFFERAPDAPAQAPPDQVAALRNKPIRDMGVQDAYTAALERDTLQGYEDFLIAYPGDPLARRVRAIVAARREAITWRRSYQADTPNAYWSYLRRYPRGPHAGDARRRLAILTAPLEPPPAFAVMDYDVPPPPPEEIVYVDRPVLVFSDPEFDFVPPPPPPFYYLPPPPPDFIVLEPPPPPIGLFILPQPLFVPIPVYVVAPIYVTPPPNNIIYANIHNTTVINNVINQPPQPVPTGPGTAGALPTAKGAAPSSAAAIPGSAATTALPLAVAQKASLIQQGKLPMPPSALMNRAAKAGAPGGPVGQMAPANAPQPANAAPNALPQGKALPKANSLPVPPPAAAAPPPNATSPSVKLTPQQPGAAPPAGVSNAPAAAAGTPKAPAGMAAPSKPSSLAPAPGPNAKPTVVPESASKPAGVQPSPNPTTALPPKPATQAAPKPPIQPEARRPPPPPAPPRPAPQMAKPAPPPPPRIAAPPPPPRVASPPPPPPRMAAPPPPPPRAAAPPPPPPRMAAPPPPPPRVAAPPPPRPAPPPAAAAKKCPPNVPRC
ncbi:caspase-like domain-containing protein [Bradyrhizobium sp. KBS0727]|uniref:caspase family protein n=1 Tax=unclassified Bradyrhizobium TaxID=2631580 RepID=UPI00110DF980|nr:MULTISPECIES: caspase domain-containing protein [unclassified Bradyrhizobium]QDW38554.1 caspase-like domain-containing protein [Bradyrhizobium sp. KBS0725]QDW45157.1 caspase-like domain-containing protein [Bradyrhizobium sp. KBS0727]